MAIPLRSGNPALNQNTFLDSARGTVVSRDGAMTVNGTINKTAFLLILVMAGAMFTWSKFDGATSMDAILPLTFGGLFGGFVIGLVTTFKQQWSPFTAPLYALLEGLFIGGISCFFELRYPGIVFQAVALTFGTLGAMLLAYRSGLIRVTDKFKLGMAAAMGGLMLVYVGSMVMSMFTHQGSMIYSSSPIGIGFSLVVIVIASLNLVLDFDMIESGAHSGAPKYMEWYGGFAMVVGLVWLYIAILRLLAKMNSRN